jgi:hypothetical protein
MQQNMDAMQKKLDELEAKSATPAAPPMVAQTNAMGHPLNLEEASPSIRLLEKTAAGEEIGAGSQVSSRHTLNDQQEAAPRPNDLTLDPKYRGFIPIPNTPALVKFNAKPRLDITSDSRNSGNPDRFVPAQIPVEGQAAHGGTEQFNVNARGSQLRVDVRAPEMAGNFRFYYQNDFFGGGGGMAYRLQQLYGQFYNVTAGFTYSCFEDPDAWPDTVDYEGPNGVVWARRALVRYMLPLNEHWQLNAGIEAPSSEVDADSTTNSFNSQNAAPDGTMNLRWEDAKWGHVQLGGVLRDIGVHGSGVGNQSVLGFGVNVSSSINLFKRDSAQVQVTYGEGIFRYLNDNFVNNDAAFSSDGDLRALPAYAFSLGYTHQWTDEFRSTATYGFVDVANQGSQGPNAYDQTHYASLNIIWQIRKHLSVGLEGLYGRKEVQSGATGDVWRAQLGLVYSFFD